MVARFLLVLAAAVSFLLWATIPSGHATTFVNWSPPTSPVTMFEGHLLAGEQPSIPPSIQAWVLTTNPVFVWANPTDDIRALERPNRSDRMAACWYGETFDVDINLMDGAIHYVSFYALDFDNQGRGQLLEAFDADTGELLNSQLVYNFEGGVYITAEVAGHVIFRFTKQQGVNAVLSGIFITSGLPTVSTTPMPSPTPQCPGRVLPNGKCAKK